jgi:hypothetical protein
MVWGLTPHEIHILVGCSSAYRDFSAIESRVPTFQILQSSASWVAWKTSVLATDSGKAAKDESAVFLIGAIWTI